MVENYFSIITRKQEKKKNIVQLVEELKPPVIDSDANLKDLFYKEQARNMAFKVFLDANVLLDFTLKRKAYLEGKKTV
ncbi:MAG TPA: hypothetical protein VN722_08135 [Hanamia sp.]|nr:hypothetical protein [Hanamia sp.]